MDNLDDTISLDEYEDCGCCDEECDDESNDMHEQDEKQQHEKYLYFDKNYRKLYELLQDFNGVSATDIGAEYAREVCDAYEKCIMNEIKQLAARG